MSKSVTFNRWTEVELETVSPMLSRKLLTLHRMMLATSSARTRRN